MKQASAIGNVMTTRDNSRPAEGRRGMRWMQDFLAPADIRINGDRPWDMQVHQPRLLRRVLLTGMEGLADAYVDGWWDCEALDQFYDHALRAALPGQIRFDLHAMIEVARQTLWNLQRPAAARRNIEDHYDRGNDLFESMLDRRMVYSCAYWKNARTLDEAQEAKLELVCRKIGLQPGERVLDIGSGWGSFLKYAAEKNGAVGMGITLSKQQLQYAVQSCAELEVQFQLLDYRALHESFDRVISLGCFEHIGQKNHRAFMQAAHRCLKEDGLCLVQSFATPRSFPNRHDSEVLWIQKRIFPGLVVPSLKQIGTAIDGLFVIEDLHNFGAYYDLTLMAWFANFDRNWPGLAERYGPRFYRMWKHYLLSCAGAFRSRKYQLWQMVLSKHGVRGGYETVR